MAAPASALAAAEHPAKRELDTAERIRTTTDDKRGWVYFHLVLAHAGHRAVRGHRRGPRPSCATYHETHNLWESVPEDVPEALARFRRLGLRLVVVSNANGTVRAKLERLGLAAFFDVILDSQEEGVEKPDPRLFERALVRSGADPRGTRCTPATSTRSTSSARARPGSRPCSWIAATSTRMPTARAWRRSWPSRIGSSRTLALDRIIHEAARSSEREDGVGASLVDEPQGD